MDGNSRIILFNYSNQKEKLIQQAENLTEGINRNDFIDLKPDDAVLTKEVLENMIHNFSTQI